MNKEKMLIPELRFPEFEKDGGWKEKEFQNIFERITTKNEENNQNVLTISAQQGLISQLDYFNKKVSAKDVSGYYLLHNGDFAYNKSYSKGYPMGAIKPLKYYDKGVVSTLYICFRAKDNYNELFFEQYFNTGLLNSEISQIAKEGGRAHGLLNVGISDFFKTKLLVPQPQEQLKIATCLSSLDDLITAHDKKLQALKDHKKGLMQNLFPQEGQQEPNYRYPEFEEDGEWVYEPFNKVYSLLVTNSFSRAKLNYDDGSVKNIHYGDIHTKFSTLFDISKEKVPFVNSNISIDNISEENLCKTGDIVFADASEDLDDIGKSIEIINLNNQKLLAGLHTLLARQIDDNLEMGFGAYLFKAPNIRRQLKREAQGAKVLGISKTRLSKIILCYPSKKEEQQKIASCLSELDKSIIAQEDKTKQLQNQKKGLMQGLFPKMER